MLDSRLLQNIIVRIVDLGIILILLRMISLRNIPCLSAYAFFHNNPNGLMIINIAVFIIAETISEAYKSDWSNNDHEDHFKL